MSKYSNASSTRLIQRHIGIIWDVQDRRIKTHFILQYESQNSNNVASLTIIKVDAKFDAWHCIWHNGLECFSTIVDAKF